ncbi:hypothetical protein [Vibrio stylophorae]|uniref:hypothetical protein n=1 Tax=Vibrio stylophorae TaxID=659351 RepID=UPI001F1A1C95|nr:hypothetical protein [Vibrio stylophorae]
MSGASAEGTPESCSLGWVVHKSADGKFGNGLNGRDWQHHAGDKYSQGSQALSEHSRFDATDLKPQHTPLSKFCYVITNEIDCEKISFSFFVHLLLDIQQAAG